MKTSPNDHNIKRHLILALLLGFALNVFSQSDSVAFANGAWLSERVDGLVLRRCQFTYESLFASNQQILIWELTPSSDFTLSFSYRPKRTKTSVMAREQNAVAAVNGSFFDMDHHFPVLFLRIDGVDLGSTTPEEAELALKDYQFGTLAIDNDRVSILKTETEPQWEAGLSYPNLMTSRPLLLFDGEILPLREDLSFVSKRHNRTAVGIRPDGTVLLVVVDGRTPEASGMSLRELQQVMRWLGCYWALNLDGGGSTTFYANLRANHGVFNCPSDNDRFDHEGERAVSNAVLVVRKHK